MTNLITDNQNILEITYYSKIMSIHTNIGYHILICGDRGICGDCTASGGKHIIADNASYIDMPLGASR